MQLKVFVVIMLICSLFMHPNHAGARHIKKRKIKKLFKHSVLLNERKRRSEVLHTLSDIKTAAFYESQRGKTYPVLWESRHNGEQMVGFTSNYIRVEKPYDKNSVNCIENVTLGSWNEEKSALKAVGSSSKQ